MRRLADGDRASFDYVFSKLRNHLRQWCATLCPADADDVVQKALMTILARASAFRPDGDVIAWAFAIAGWEIRSIKRRQARQVPIAELHTHATGPSPEQTAIEADLRAALAQTVETLNDSDRRVIAHLAGASGPRDATTRKRLSRALARLRIAWRRIHDER